MCVCKFAFKILHRKSSKGQTLLSGQRVALHQEELMMRSKSFIFSYFSFSVFSSFHNKNILFKRAYFLIGGEKSVTSPGCTAVPPVVIAHCVLFSCSAKWSKTGGS